MKNCVVFGEVKRGVLLFQYSSQMCKVKQGCEQFKDVFMKLVCIVLFSLSFLLNGCEKHSLNTDDNIYTRPSVERFRPRFAPIPRPVLPMRICIHSYYELKQLLGTSQVTAQSVILANGVTMQPGADLRSANYEAVRQNQPNSLLESKLIVEWRFPAGNWQINISDGWSLGCV